MKTCRVCKIEKLEEDFYQSKFTKNKCKECYRQSYLKAKNTTLKKYKEKNREKLLINSKKYYAINKDKILLKQKEKDKNISIEEREKKNILAREAARKRKENPLYRQKLSERDKIRRNENREYLKKVRRERCKRRYDTNTAYKLEVLLKTGFYKAIKRKSGKKQKSIMKIIGCTQEFLKEYISNQFKPEMNWLNHGKIWEIDHIIPIDSFNLESLEEQKKCFHYSNLQPLFKTTEIAKSLGYENEIGNHNKSNKIEQ